MKHINIKYINRCAWIVLIMTVAFIAYDIGCMILYDKSTDNNINSECAANMNNVEYSAENNASVGMVGIAVTAFAEENENIDEVKEIEYADAMPSRVRLEMESILQLPELPTGCESVALTMLLKYYGFDDLEKTTVADEYLVYSDSFVTGFVGNPYSRSGAGCYAPGLVKTANNFFEDRQSLLNAKNLTGSTPQTLYKYVANGTPVVVWNTAYFIDNSPNGIKEVYKGKTYEWDSSEHCVVFTGYDFNRNVVIINDPLEGIVERDADRFWELYENLGSMAMIVR